MDSVDYGVGIPAGISRLQLLTFVIVILLIMFSFLSPPPQGLSRDGQFALTILGMSLLLWQSKTLPYIATSLLVVGLVYYLGLASSFEEATVGFSSTLFFFFFTILILGHSISKVGLDGRVAQRLLIEAKTPKAALRRLGQYIIALSFIMPSGLARMVAFTPVIEEVNDDYGLGEDSPFLTSSFLVMGQLNPIASMSLMTGGGLSIIGSSMVTAAGYPVEWLEWALYMAPPTIFIFAIGLLGVERLYPPSSEDNGVSANAAKAGKEPLSRDQLIVAIVMGGTLFAWAASSFVGIPTILPAIIAIVILSAPYVNVLEAADLSEVSWGILFIIGAMLSLIDALQRTGAFEWIVANISSIIPFDLLSEPALVGFLLFFTVVLRTLFPNGSTTLIVVLPIVISFAESYGLDVQHMVYATTLVVGSTVFLPLHIPPALLAANRGHVNNRQVFIYGLFTLLTACLAVVLAWFFYWPAVNLIFR